MYRFKIFVGEESPFTELEKEINEWLEGNQHVTVIDTDISLSKRVKDNQEQLVCIFIVFYEEL